jgi:hypothetical protein
VYAAAAEDRITEKKVMRMAGYRRLSVAYLSHRDVAATRHLLRFSMLGGSCIFWRNIAAHLSTTTLSRTRAYRYHGTAKLDL